MKAQLLGLACLVHMAHPYSLGIQHRARCAAPRAAVTSLVDTDRVGRDPCHAPPWITENHELLAELAAASTKEPKAATASSSAAISSIVHLEDLQAALTRAQANNRLVVVKYYAPQCKSCLSMKRPFERVAEGPLGARADFYEVESSAAKVLLALGNIDKTPVVHVYAGGVLQDACAINNKLLFEEFTSSLMNLAQVMCREPAMALQSSRGSMATRGPSDFDI